MRFAKDALEPLVAALRAGAGVRAKRDVQRVARALGPGSGANAAMPAMTGIAAIANGDDAAAIPDRDGYTLLAAEGMAAQFVAAEPWFAGFCAVMTNVSDIAAMGGRAQAIVDVLFAGPDDAQTEQVLAGLSAGAELFAVPLVGGHTGRSHDQCYLSAAIVGRARRLITSFAARPADVIVACYDLHGAFRAETLNFDAVSGRDPRRVRAQLALLPELAEAELVHAGKDISMAGLVGTLLMLLETSGCGATLDLCAIPAPASAQHEPLRWLQAFPSFGYLLACRARDLHEVLARCEALGLSAAAVAEVNETSRLELSCEGHNQTYWDLAREPLLGFGPNTITATRETHHA